MRTVECTKSYLGLPIVVGKNKAKAFFKVVGRDSSKIKGWSKRLLSFRGKEVFLKAVLQSLPTYFLSIFLLPQGIIDNVKFKLKNYWWASKHKNWGWAMLI